MRSPPRPMTAGVESPTLQGAYAQRAKSARPTLSRPGTVPSKPSPRLLSAGYQPPSAYDIARRRQRAPNEDFLEVSYEPFVLPSASRSAPVSARRRAATVVAPRPLERNITNVQVNEVGRPTTASTAWSNEPKRYHLGVYRGFLTGDMV